MSLSDLASLGSFVSGVAVLISLIYLSLQVRQAERNQRALMQQGRSERIQAATFQRLEPHNVVATRRGASGEPDISDDQAYAFVGLAMTNFMGAEDSYLHHRAGTIDPESWSSDELRLRGLVAQPPYRAVWRVVRMGFGEKYRAYVDALMHEAVPTAPADTVGTWRTYLAEEMARVAPQA